MLTPARILGAVLAAALLPGCSLRTVWNDAPPPPPVITPAPETSQPDERTLHPYTGAVATRATCTRAGSLLLDELEDRDMVGGAITYPVGAMVKANAKWWTVAVATRVERNDSGYTRDNVPAYRVFVTNSPSYPAEDFDAELFTWELSDPAADPAAAKALACAKRLPLPKPKPEPGSPESYTGRLGRDAACIELTAGQLERFQQVGQVGGAITYPRGVRVKSNQRWWTVAVATQVHPNGEGLTEDNVPATALFVTNSPSGKAKDVLSFPITQHRGDAAVRKALSCLAA